MPFGCSVATKHGLCRAEVLADGKTNAMQTAAECGTACSSSSKCNAWQWCADDDGCPTEFGSSADPLPAQGCHLQAQKLAPGNPLYGWRPSRFVAGYNGGARRTRHTLLAPRLAVFTLQSLALNKGICPDHLIKTTELQGPLVMIRYACPCARA